MNRMNFPHMKVWGISNFIYKKIQSNNFLVVNLFLCPINFIKFIGQDKESRAFPENI